MASGGSPVFVKSIKLLEIQCDAGTQIRAGLTEEVVCEYSERLLAGDQFPPVDVFFDGKAYYLADGFHRIQAARRAKIEAFHCTVHPGGADDALWFAIGANRKNGWPRTVADKHHAIELALTKFPQKTQEQVAQHVGCDRSYVSKVGNELVNIHKLKLPASRKGKDGKSRPTKYKSRKKVNFQETPPIAPSAPLTAPQLPTGTTSASLPTGSNQDFSTIVKIKFEKWMGQWAAADFPKVRSILREVLKE